MLDQIGILFLINSLSAVGYSLIAPLYPLIAREKEVQEGLVGIIFASFAVSNIIIIPIIPTLVVSIGKKNLFRNAILLEGTCTIVYGIIHYIPFKGLFILISFVLRFSQGIGCAITSTLIYSIAASNSDEEAIKTNIGYMELAYSIGLTVGPLIGSFFYHFLGYSFPFFISGVAMLSSYKFLGYLKIEEVTPDKSPNFFQPLANLGILMTFIAVFLDMLSTSFIYPVFSTHLVDKFGLSVEKTSFFFIVEMITYFFTIQYLGRLSEILGSKLTMAVGMVINWVCVLMLSPVGLFPQSLIIIIFGLLGIGAAGALITIPAIVDLMENIRDYLSIEEELANDYASGLYNLSVNFAESAGPIIGGFLTQKGGFDFSCWTVSTCNIIYFGLFSLHNWKFIQEQVGKPREGEDEEESGGERQRSIGLVSPKGYRRQYSIISRYSFPNKIARTRSLSRTFRRASGLSDIK